MKRIFILLTDRFLPSFEASLLTTDLVLVGPNLEFKHSLARVRKIGLPSSNVQEQLANQVATALTSIRSPVGELLEAVSNEVYSYVLRPLVAVIEETLIQASEYPTAKIIIVHAKRINQNVPLFGLSTTESRRGSRSLLGAYIAYQIRGIPELVKRTEFVEVGGDILCKEIFRSLILRTLDRAVRIKFTSSLIAIGVLRPKLKLSGKFLGEAIVLVRAFHQARFAKRLCDALEEQSLEVLVVPQFMQGGLIHTLRTLIPSLGHHGVSVPTRRDLRVANRQASHDRQSLRDFAHFEFSIELNIENHHLRFKVQGIARELLNFSVLLVYRRLLSAFLTRRSAHRLINFELVGRIAGLDRLAADEADCRIATIQTALISELPHPIFPHSHVFFADGPQSSARLSGIGVKKRGAVEYAGSSVPVQPLRFSASSKVLAFFTQPYERETTILILRALVEYCYARRCRLVVKAHPRDDSAYLDVLGNDPFIATVVDRSIDPQELLFQSDVCITRTSSVARESLALGRPVVLCLWSEFDKSIRADYAEQVGEFDHRTFCKQQLFDLLDNEHALAGSASRLREILFGNLKTEDLARRACQI